jgi:hypothetical protein
LTWPAIQAARRHDAAARVPFFIGSAQAGTVAHVHLQALGGWPRWLRVEAAGVHLLADEPDTALQQINTQLHRLGLIRGWRDERFAVPALADPAWPLARMERAAARFWGTLTLGAHANGFVAGCRRPAHTPVDRPARAGQAHRPRPVGQPHRRRRARRPDAVADPAPRGLGGSRSAAGGPGRTCAPAA